MEECWIDAQDPNQIDIENDAFNHIQQALYGTFDADSCACQWLFSGICPSVPPISARVRLISVETQSSRADVVLRGFILFIRQLLLCSEKWIMDLGFIIILDVIYGNSFR